MKTTTTDTVATTLGLDRDTEALKRIAKFVRVNGDAGLAEAAKQVARLDELRPGEIADRWSYCIDVYNSNAARAVALYPLLYLLENGLRARIDSILASQFSNPKWFLDPRQYLANQHVIDAFVSGEKLKEIQDRAQPNGIRDFASGFEFCQRLDWWALNQILFANYTTRLRFIFTGATRSPVLKEVSSGLQELAKARNEVAHHRPVSLNFYKETRQLASSFLEYLEFDVERAAKRLLKRTSQIQA